MVSSLIFQKFSGEGLTEPPPQTPPPAFSRASPSVRASPSILGRFAPSTRASPSILGRFAPSIRASPSTFDWGPWFGPPQNKFLDPPLIVYCHSFQYSVWFLNISKIDTITQPNIASTNIPRTKYGNQLAPSNSSNLRDPSVLWSKIGVLLNPPNTTSDSTFSADELADFFQTKIDKIRRATSGVMPPVIEPRQISTLSGFKPVSAEEISRIIGALTLETLPAGSCTNLAH